jgi:hypothetical protein
VTKTEPKQATPEQAQNFTKRIDAEFEKFSKVKGQINSTWWTLGCLVRDAIELCVPKVLNLAVDEWMGKRFKESKAKVYRALAIARSLAHLPKKTLMQLTEANAYELARLPIIRMKSPNAKERKQRTVWIKMALTMSAEDFKKSVADALRGKTEKDESFQKSKYVPGLKLPIELIGKWDSAMEKIAAIMHVDMQEKKGRYIIVLEAISVLIDSTPIQVLKTELKGDDEAPTVSGLGLGQGSRAQNSR